MNRGQTQENNRGKGAFSRAPSRLFGSAADKLLLVLLLFCVCLFILYPMLCILFRSLQEEAGLSLVHYWEVWEDYRRNLWNSFFTGVLTALLSTLLSVCTALFISTRRGKVKLLCMAVLLITMVSPPFLSSLAYIQLYGRRGWITYRLLGIRWNPYNYWGVVLMQSLSFVPLNALLLNGVLTRMDALSIQSARDLGASPAAILRDVVLPLIRPGSLVVLLLSFVRSLADFGTPIIIGGRFSTLASEIYLQLIGYSDLEKASAMNMFLMLPSIAAFFVYRKLMIRSDAMAGSARSRQEVLDLKLLRAGPLGLGAVGVSLLFFVAMLLQYGCIFISGFLKSVKGVYSFTLEHLETLLQYDGVTMLRSVAYALVVAVAGTLFAALFTYYMNRRKVPGRSLFDCLATLPYMIPGTCFGIGYILAFHQEPFRWTGTAFIVMANMLFKQLPTSTKICAASLAQIPRTLEQSVRDLGGGRLAVIRDVIFPGLRPAFLSSFVYNFSSSMTTAGAILFLINPGKKLAVFKLFDSVYMGEYAQASLMATLIILIVLLVEGMAFFLSRKAERGNVS